VAAGDLIAGLTVWAVLVPEALAYATIAGVSPVVGLYAAPPALVLYAAFGSSKHLVTGPMAATAALSAAVVADLVADPSQAAEFTAVVALVTGALAVIAGLSGSGSSPTSSPNPCSRGSSSGWP
jgi:sulfate permease, SulP family